MAKKSGESGAPMDAVQIINGVVLSGEWQQPRIESPQRVVYSDELNDPDLGTVLQWHLSLCQICDPTSPPSVFGVRPANFCDEYFEIIQEYREWEGNYAWMGKP